MGEVGVLVERPRQFVERMHDGRLRVGFAFVDGIQRRHLPPHQ
jgi:hypothetical protein